MVRVAVKLLIIFFVAYVGVYVGYGRLEKRLLVPPSTVPHQPAKEKPAEKTRQVLQKTSNYQIIVARNIFEAILEPPKVVPKKKAPVKVEKKPEPTTLKLVLQGTVVGNDQDARAIIVDQKKKKQDIYQIGDAVQGALITAVERGKVVLEFNGKKQFLLINERKGGPGGASNARGVSRSSPKPKASASKPKASPFVMKASGTAFSKKKRRPAPAVKPHRRISFKQDEEEEDLESVQPVEPDEQEDELEEPLAEEALQEDVEAPEEPGLEDEILTE